MRDCRTRRRDTTSAALQRPLMHCVMSAASSSTHQALQTPQAATNTFNPQGWIKWPLIRAHLCTLAVNVGFNSSWRAPREAFRYGGLQFGLLTTLASLIVLPLALLQLALGQLSQQDSVGIWRAVPFFRGVGYLRLLVSALGCVYSAIYVALSAAYFLYTLSNFIPFRACSDPRLNEVGYEDIINSTSCLNATFLAPVSQKPEYYIAMSLIICFIWIVLPFLLYSPVKLMKRTFYVLGPIILLMGFIIAPGIGSWGNLSSFHSVDDWRWFVEPSVWLSALAQALLAAQLAGGYLVAAGHGVYSAVDVQWTAVVFVGTNIVTTWLGLVFWFAVAGDTALDAGAAAVLEQAYRVAAKHRLSVAWPLAVFATMFLSGVITMLTFLYPLYERTRRAGGARWRAWCAGGCAVGAAASLAALAGRWQALQLLEDDTVPLLACLATVLEVLAFVCIYGWKVLMEDIAFLTGQDLSKLWMMGWCAAPGVIAPFALWWAAVAVAAAVADQWASPWTAAGAIASLATTLLVVIGLAVVAVVQQDQYDVLGKLKASFRPSRHWGPRDPIAHYYWLARKDAGAREPGSAAPRRFRRRQPGQLSGALSILDIAHAAPASPNKDVNSNELKKRSHSDDWIYTVYRRRYLEEAFSEYLAKKKKVRSLSLDWAQIPRVRQNTKIMELKVLRRNDYNDIYPAESLESIRVHK